MAFLVLSLAHLLLIPLAVRETARPLADLVRVAYSFSSSCSGEDRRDGALEEGLGHRIVPVFRCEVIRGRDGMPDVTRQAGVENSRVR